MTYQAKATNRGNDMNAVKSIEDNRKGLVDNCDDAKWFAVCELHGCLIGVSTKREAQQIKNAEFCEFCAEGSN